MRFVNALFSLERPAPAGLVVSLSLMLFLFTSGCSSTNAQTKPQPSTYKLDLERPPSIPSLASGEQTPPSADQFGSQLETAGGNWLYGPGFGRTILNVGTFIVFPPYGLYILSHAVSSLAGYEPLYITDALPEKPRREVLAVYNEVTSVPGRMSAAVGRTEYRGPSSYEEHTPVSYQATISRSSIRGN